ncbi:MAG: hypothetical protein ABL931_03180 [Usitatibacteraceae bacterium]
MFAAYAGRRRLENSEPVAAQQVFKRLFEIEQELEHGIDSKVVSLHLRASLVRANEANISLTLQICDGQKYWRRQFEILGYAASGSS